MIELFLLNLFILLFLHALADFTLQTDIMAKLKNRNTDLKRKKQWLEDPKSIPIPSGQKYQLTWIYWLTAHSLIQGGLIGLVFGNWYLAIIEFIMHWLIDFLKTNGYTNIHHDQGMHIFLRIIYGVILIL